MKNSKTKDIHTEVPELVTAKCHEAYDRIYEECGIAPGTATKTRRSITMRRGRIIAACAAAALITVPAGIYAYEQHSASIAHTSPYQNTVVIPPQETAEQYMALEVGWLPAGYSYDEAEGKYHSAEGGGISCMFLKLPENTAVTETRNFSVSCKQYETETAQILLSESAQKPDTDHFYRHEIWVVFTGTNYAAHAFLTSDLDEAAVMQFAEGLSLCSADTETAGTYLAPEKGTGNGGTVTSAYVLDPERALYVPGDTITFEEQNSYSTDITDTLSVTVNKVTLQKNFDGITKDGCANPADFSAYLDADGNVVDNVRTWYNRGDGVNTLDEDVLTETIPQRIMVMELTYTNTSDHDVEYLLSPSLFTIRDGKASDIYWLRDGAAETSRDSLLTLYNECRPFSLQTEARTDKNHLLLAPGESAQVQLAYLVGEDMLGNLYLNVHRHFSLAESMPVLDLCGLR